MLFCCLSRNSKKNYNSEKYAPAPVASLIGYKIYEVNNGYAAFELDPAEI